MWACKTNDTVAIIGILLVIPVTVSGVTENERVFLRYTAHGFLLYYMADRVRIERLTSILRSARDNCDLTVSRENITPCTRTSCPDCTLNAFSSGN